MVRGRELEGLNWKLCRPCSFPCAPRVVSMAWMWLLPGGDGGRERGGSEEGEREE